MLLKYILCQRHTKEIRQNMTLFEILLFENTISKKQTKSFERIKLCFVGKFFYFEFERENVCAIGRQV